MTRSRKPLLIIVIGLLLSLSLYLGLLFGNVKAAPAPFSDLPSNPLYYPAIATFQNQSIIIGDTLGGEPKGKLRPVDHLTRAEFTKVATLIHLLESVQSGELEGKLSEYLNISLNDFIFKTDYLLRPYYSSKPPAPKFTDVPDKDLTCAKDPGGCEPWYTQYVNYMASLGTIKGYTEDNTFRPNNTLLRIHALKMVMVEDGSIPAEEDVRFLRIASDPRIQNREVRCLAGAEDYILAANGGADNFDAKNLLAYALLADKLDIFGNRCQFFEEKKCQHSFCPGRTSAKAPHPPRGGKVLCPDHHHSRITTRPCF